MATEFKDEELYQNPALKGFNANWEGFKHVLKTTAITALKGAVIGAVVLGVLGAISIGWGLGGLSVAINTVGGWLGFTPALKLGTDAIMAMAMQGLLLGGAAGAAVGLANGVSGAEDAVEDQAQTMITQHNRARQLDTQQQMMAQNLANLNSQRTQVQQSFMPQPNPQIAGVMNFGQGHTQNARGA